MMELPCTLKLRHTGSDTKGGGIGPMVTQNLSCTLAASVQDQTLITGGYDAIGFEYLQGEKSRKPFAENGEAQALSSGCHDAAVAYCYDGYNQSTHEEVPMTIRSACGGTEGNDATPKVAYGFSHSNSNTSMQTKPKEECAMTLRSAVTGEGATIQTIGFKAGQSKDGGLGDEREVSPTLSHKPSALEPTLAQSQCDLSQMRYIVRRLTPTEAERLMGVPDGYTIPVGLRRFFGADGEPAPELVAEFQSRFDTFNAIMAEYEHSKPPKPKSAKQVADWLKKISDAETCPDSPRYKGLGNGMATNQPRWIFLRLLALGEGVDPFTGEEL